MLNPDPAKLRYLGIDLRSRTRRRWVVSITWALFFVGMAMLSNWFDSQRYFMSHPLLALGLALGAVILYTLGSVFRDGGALKHFDLPTWRLRGLRGQFVLLQSLDDWARYKHGARLDELPLEQQEEVLRTYRMGFYFFPADKSMTPERLDEREIAVRNQASMSTLKWLTLFCFSFAATYATSSGLHRMDVVLGLMTIGVIALNGPKSIILWNEPDPRIGNDLAPVPDNPGRGIPGNASTA
jgi:hypothetical protein